VARFRGATGQILASGAMWPSSRECRKMYGNDGGRNHETFSGRCKGGRVRGDEAVLITCLSQEKLKDSPVVKSNESENTSDYKPKWYP